MDRVLLVESRFIWVTTGNHFFGFSLLLYALFSQELSLSVSYKVVCYMRDSAVFKKTTVLGIVHMKAG